MPKISSTFWKIHLLCVTTGNKEGERGDFSTNKASALEMAPKLYLESTGNTVNSNDNDELVLWKYWLNSSAK